MNAKKPADEQAAKIRTLTIERDEARKRLNLARQTILHEVAKGAELCEQVNAIRKLAFDTAGDPADILTAIKDVLK